MGRIDQELTVINETSEISEPDQTPTKIIARTPKRVIEESEVINQDKEQGDFSRNEADIL